MARRSPAPSDEPTVVRYRLPAIGPFAAEPLLAFLADRAVDGVEAVDGRRYRRVLRLGQGPALVDAAVTGRGVIAEVRLSAPSDATAASAALRRLFDLDADGAVVDAALGADPLLGPLVRATPGLRRPGAVDGTEALVRAIVGQQVSVAGARTILGRLAHESGEALPPRLAAVAGGLTHAFPTAVALADRDPVELPMPRARARALVAAASAVDAGHLDLSPAADRAHTRSALLDLAGIGPWTADYVRLRALGDPDVFLPGDLAARRGLAAVGGPGDPAGAAAAAEAWRPWRSYALHHLWWRA